MQSPTGNSTPSESRTMFSPELQPPHPYQSPSPSIASLHPHLRPPQQCSPGEVLGASPELGSEADSGDLVISSSFQTAAGSVSKESTHEKSVSESCITDPNWVSRETKTMIPMINTKVRNLHLASRTWYVLFPSAFLPLSGGVLVM